MGEFVAKKYDNTSHMVWWNGHGMICRTDSLGNAARIADALNAQAAPPAAAVSASGHFEVLRELSATLIGRSQERHAAIEWALERIEAQPAGAVPATNVTPMRQRRTDLARLVESIKAAVYAHGNGNGLSVTEAIGAIEIAKLELLKEQEQ